MLPFLVADPQSQLVNNSGPKIKRLLEYSNQDSYITTSVACRNALIPTVPKDQRGDNNNRFPAWAAEKFFKDVSNYNLIYNYLIIFYNAITNSYLHLN